MCYLSVFLFVLQAECVRKAAEIGGICGSEVPVREAILIALQIPKTILAQYGRSVIFRVEADGQKMRFVVVGGLLEFVMDLRELAAQARTEFGMGQRV